MDKSQIASIPQVAALLAQIAPQDQAAVLDLLAATTAAATGAGAIPTQRTDLRRDMGVPNQRYKLWNAYYSIVRFSASTVTTNPGPPATTTVTWNGGTELRPFSYRINDPLTSAGFPAAFGLATQAETNLVKSSETLAGEQLLIYGVSLMPSLTTDSGAWAWVTDNTSVVISMDGDQRRYRLGRPMMVPASGGSMGLAFSTVTPYQGGLWSNGNPQIDNYYPFPEPIVWTSSGETDSNFNLILRLERGVTLTSSTAAGSPEVAGVDFGAFVDVMARLHTSQTASRSLNQ